MNTSTSPAAERPIGRRGQDLAVALWVSFLVAGFASILFFATFDPLALEDDAAILKEAFASRMRGYTLGFFFFWSLTLLTSVLTLFLVRTARASGEPPR